jgi:hypothetical protein
MPVASKGLGFEPWYYPNQLSTIIFVEQNWKHQCWCWYGSSHPLTIRLCCWFPRTPSQHATCRGKGNNKVKKGKKKQEVKEQGRATQATSKGKSKTMAMQLRQQGQQQGQRNKGKCNDGKLNGATRGKGITGNNVNKRNKHEINNKNNKGKGKV